MWHVDRFHWHAAFTAVPTSLCIVKNMCIFTYTDCLEIVYEILLLPKNALWEIFLHKFRVAQSVVGVFVIGVPA